MTKLDGSRQSQLWKQDTLYRCPEPASSAISYTQVTERWHLTNISFSWAEWTFSFSLWQLDLDPFPPEERPEVKVKEGKGMVLLCDPPYHFPGEWGFPNYKHLGKGKAWFFSATRCTAFQVNGVSQTIDTSGIKWGHPRVLAMIIR